MSPISSMLLTGASGLLGLRLQKILARHCKIYAVVRAMPTEVVDSVEYIVADLAGELNVRSLPSQIDAVVHLAQALDARSFPAGAREIFMINAGTTASLLDYAYKAGARSFVLASTGGLYSKSSLPLNEGSPIIEGDGPLSFYFASKRCAEVIAQQYSPFLNTTIIRPFFMYGPGQRSGMLIPRLIDNIKTGTAITLRGGEGATINPIFVDDAADAVVEILQCEAPFHIINLAGPEKVTIRQIAEQIGRLINRTPIFQLEQGSADEFLADVSLINGLLKKPMRSVALGLRDTIGQVG